ncbi:MAG: hypothetical protein K8W52_26090 [Deltaproteobacteria bacterium]|nr:hypothetical protein [Deltaproteobacteria bacterium]
MRRLAVTVALVAGCRGTSSAPAPGGSASGAPPVAVLDEPAARAAVVAIGEGALAELGQATPAAAAEDGMIRAIGPCVRPTADEQAALRQRLEPWTVAALGPRSATVELTVRFGCVARGGIIVNAQRNDGSEGLGRGRWWTLRVSPTAIEALHAIEGVASIDFTEFADAETLQTLALVDLDGDGVLDPVDADDLHVNGGMHGEVTVSVPGPSGAVVGRLTGEVLVADAQPDPRTLVLALQEAHDEHPAFWRCVTTAGPWTVCPAAAAASTLGRRWRAAELLATSPETAMTDAGLMAETLAALAVPEAAQAPLVAYATAHGSAFGAAIAKVGRARALPIVERTGPEEEAAEASAQAALAAQLRAALHEPACAAAPDAQRAAAMSAITRWARSREPGFSALDLRGSCASKTAAYWIARWERRPDKGPTALRAGVFYIKGATVALVVETAMPEPEMRGAGGDMSWPGPDIVAKFSDTGASLTALAAVVSPPPEDAEDLAAVAPPRALTAVVDGAVTGTHPLADGDALQWGAADAALGFTMVSDPLARTATADAATFWHAAAGGVIAVATVAIGSPRAPMTAKEPVAQLLERSERMILAAALVSDPIEGPLTPDVRADRLAAAALLGAPKAILDAAAAAAN